MATIDLGRVTPIYHGDYDNTATYELNDIVLYDGALYWHVSDTPTTGTVPTDATVWTLAMAYALDDVPTEDSQNAVKSGGVYTALQAVQNDIQDLQDAIDEANEKVLDAYPTDTASGSIASFPDGADAIPVKSLTAQITPVQSGSGDPSPTNIRPITGWTGAQVTRAGANCLNESDLVTGAWLDNSTGTYQYNPSGYGTRRATQNYQPCKPSTAYYFAAYTNGTVDSGTYALLACWYDSSKTFISGRNANVSPSAITSPANAAYYRLGVLSAANTAAVNYPSSVTAYAPYNGATYTVSWADEVFGGSADVATGELVSDMRSGNSFGTWNLITTVTPNYFETANIVETLDLERRGELLCNRYKTATPSAVITDDYCCGFTSNGRLRVRDSRFTTSADFAASLTDAQFVYPLATPTSAEFDPVEVKTLLGDNNIWADCGDVSVEYRADTGLYIEKKLGA